MRFLIVDDRAESREVIRELLEMRGHEVVGEAGDAPGALAVAERCRPEAVLLDVRLGGQSGFDVARSLTAARPELAILMISVDPDMSPALVDACGARGFVPKQRLHTVDLKALLGAERRRAPE
jgi:DNA-binding NarL/FixJ family response regulator